MLNFFWLSDVIFEATSKKSNQTLCQVLLIGLIIFLTAVNPHHTQAASYYFSASSGNDENTVTQAKNSATPWKSLNKLNAIMPTLLPGDSVLFKKGDIFYGSIVIKASGTAASRIVFGSYGQGDRPVINGFAKLSAWTSLGNGIFETDAPGEGKSLVIDGSQLAMGRFPNAGYLSYESHTGNTSITDAQLSSATNWTDAEVVIRKNRWTMDRNTITAHTGGSLTYTSGSSAVPIDGFGYFIQKSAKTLDQFGEWYFDSARKKMLVYFGEKDPSAYTVTTSQVNSLIEIRDRSFISFENISFVGAGGNSFQMVGAKNVTLKNCNIDLTGAEAISASYCPSLTVENVTINHSLSGGITLDAGCTNALITNSKILNTGTMPGMGKSGTGTYEGITSFGENTQIIKNVIDNTGYNGIYFGGSSTLVKNNFINSFCLVKDDGAGIYVGDWFASTNKSIIGNIVTNGVGAGAGTNKPASFEAEGIYIDDNTASVTVSGNTVASVANNGLKVHNAKDISVINNTSYNNGVQLRLEQDHYIASSSLLRNVNVKNNILFSRSAAQSVSKLSTHQDDLTSFGQLDSNSYSRPANEEEIIEASFYKEGKFVNQQHDLDTWKSASGKDKASQTSPLRIPSYTLIKTIGNNKFANGSFDKNINETYSWSVINDVQSSFATGIMDGGALKLSFSNAIDNRVTVNMKVGKLLTNMKYILKFSITASVKGKSVQSYLRKTSAPYTVISNTKFTKLDDKRQEVEVLLSSTADETDASVIFDFEQASGQFYIDNVQLLEAEIKETNFSDFILFEYNPGSDSKTIALSKAYVDLKNNKYSDKVTLQPYSSIVLLAVETPVLAQTTAPAETGAPKESAPAETSAPKETVSVKASQQIIFSNLETKTDNKPVTIMATSTSGLPVNLQLLSGPAVLINNVLNFNGPGTAVVQASQNGNEKYEPATTTTQIVNVITTAAVPSIPAAPVKTPVTITEPNRSERLNVSIYSYPNPFISTLTLQVSTPVSCSGTLLLYDSHGKMIHKIYSGLMNAEERQNFTIDASNLGLAKGLYIVRLVTDNQVSVQKVIKTE